MNLKLVLCVYDKKWVTIAHWASLCMQVGLNKVAVKRI